MQKKQLILIIINY